MTFRRITRALTLFAPLALTAFAPAHAQSGTPALMAPLANPDPRLAQIHAAMGRSRAPGQVAISPDGTLIAWTIRAAEGVTLHLTSLPDADPTKEKIIAPTPATACSNYSPVWAPDSQSLAYTSTCEAKTDKQDQIFLYSRTSGDSRQISHLNGIFQELAFAPDGQSISFLFVENATRSAGALAAMKPWAGVIGEDGVEIQRVASVNVQSGAMTFLTPANLHVYEFASSLDGHLITYIAANPPGENNWWVSKLYTQAGSAAPRAIFDPAVTKTSLHGRQIAVPRFSFDGKRIAFIGGLMSDQGSTGGDIWTISTTGGEPTNATPTIDGSPTWFAWTGNDTVGMSEDRRGHSLLNVWNVDTRKQVDVVDLGETNITGGPIKMAVSISTTGKLAFIKSGHEQAPEIFAGPYNKLAQITHLNDGAKPAARVESVEWKNDKYSVQGWLTYPANYDASKKYPLIISVHGGPSASASANWGGSVWAQLGYFVLAPNPRGSFGQGEAFTAANYKDFGYGDLRDILAGMDAVEKKVSIDTRREGLMGWSYGGFMTMFAVTQTHRFRAAVAGAGISNWKSYYGENSIDQWMVPFFGATVYDDPAAYAKSSAIEYIKNATTPTLVVVGDRDGECPAPQSFEFWHALRAQGTKTQLVVFPNEGHGFRDPGHIRDLEAREVAWFTENMPAAQ